MEEVKEESEEEIQEGAEGQEAEESDDENDEGYDYEKELGRMHKQMKWVLRVIYMLKVE